MKKNFLREQHQTKQIKTKQNKTKQNKTKQNKTPCETIKTTCKIQKQSR